MYAITKLYRSDSSSMRSYNTDEITPEELQSGADVNTRIYISVREDNDNTDISVDYSQLITDTDLGRLETWDQLSARLTDEHVIGYKTDLPGYIAGGDNPRYPARTWDVMNTLQTFAVDYGEYLSDRHGILAYRHNLPDLRISLYEGADPKPDLNRCLPVVNGYVCRPIYRQEKEHLYALDGARLCWQQATHMTPEVQLIDFSLIGDISTHPIYLNAPSPEHDGFVLSFNSRNHGYSLDADWILTSKKYDLRKYTPIVVLGGIAILPDKITVFNHNSCRFPVQDVPWDTALVYKKYLIDESSTTAEMHYDSLAVKDYLDSQMTADIFSKDTFVVLVHAPRLYVARVPVDVWQNGITMNLTAALGLLLHDRTGTIRNYHLNTYSDRKELVIQNMEELFRADHPVRDGQLAFINPDHVHPFPNVNISNCTMIHLMR